MRVPIDRPLSMWIRQLIARDKVFLFYYTDEWKELRAEVMEYFHSECQECLKRGRYTRADCVHHVNHLRDAPQYALSKYYTDSKGERQYNLVALCNDCHNKAHPEKAVKGNKERFTNEERWE